VLSQKPSPSHSLSSRFCARIRWMGRKYGGQEQVRRNIKRSRVAGVEAKQHIQLQKTNTQQLFIFSQTLSYKQFSRHSCHSPPSIEKRKTMSSNSNFTYSHSSKGSQPSDPGSSSGSGCQLRSSTHRHNTAEASQQTQADSLGTSPNTQDTIHLTQDRATTPSTQSVTSLQITPNVDINVVLQALTAAVEAECRPGSAAIPSRQGIGTKGTGVIAELPCNDPKPLFNSRDIPIIGHGSCSPYRQTSSKPQTS